MCYQEALPKCRFLSRVDSLFTIGDRHWRKVAATFEKAESENSLPSVRERGESESETRSTFITERYASGGLRL